ncbi:MAG: glucose-6-phosphate isomerase [Bdellovibrionales bacterium]
MSNLTNSPAWQGLLQHHQGFPAKWPTPDIRMLSAAGLTLDYARQPLTGDTLPLLYKLALQEDINGWRAKLFSGSTVNLSESRGAEHWALRQTPLRDDLASVEERLWEFADSVRRDGFTTVINIGIGGSDLGPHLVTDALRNFCVDAIDIRFISNIDPADFAAATQGADADRTLFIIASKSFGTPETIANAERAKVWLGQRKTARHFAAVTSNSHAAVAFGISADNCFAFPDTIGGRYSLWGPVGLICRIALGRKHWADLLDGARQMDEHFRTAKIEQSAPLLLALLSVWNTSFCQSRAHAILPYSSRLRLLPDHLQQLAMESNGKSVTQDGEPVTWATAPVLFGGIGTNAQHSFYQLLHQGTHIIPSDIILLADSDEHLLASGLAQAKALYEGRQDSALPPYRQFAGQRPSTLIILPTLAPVTLGAMLALYEHKTFCEGVLWRINPFDQWGVELGKQMAGDIYPALHDKAAPPDALTAATISKIRAYRGT